jgi:hypothetical protein
VRRFAAAVLLSGFVALLTFGLSGCGGSSTQPIGVSLTSSSNGIDQAQTVTLTASVTNDSKNAGVQWSVSGGGTLSGQTATAATYNAPASVTSSFIATITATSVTNPAQFSNLEIKVNPLPSITTASLAAATAGTLYSATLTASGGTNPLKWTITSGTLPAGLSLSTAGSITGIPTAASSGTITFKVTDATGAYDTTAITLTVNPPPALTIATTSLPGGTIGTAYNQTLQASGGVPTYTWKITAGSLPAGLSLSSAGVISGVPTGTSTSTSTFTVTVTDSQTPTAATKSASLSITVTEPPLSVTTTSATLAVGSKGTAYSQTLLAIGGTPPYTWSITAGALPPGLSLSNPSTGVISGTPTATGTSTFTVMVTDSVAGTATASLSIAINPPLAITTTSLPGGSTGTAYSTTMTASGGAQPYAWKVATGSLPAGLSINSGTGVISGTPTATGTSNFTITVTDSEVPAVNASASLSIAISTASCVNNASLEGSYAMSLNGWNGSVNSAALGSFAADGAGNVSGGILDVNDQTNGPKSGTFTGTYCVSSNNLATLKVTYGGGLSGNNTFAFVLNSNGSNGSIIYYDNSNLKASGLLRQQDTTAFVTSKINGNYAFGLVGAYGGVSANRFAMAGSFTSAGNGDLTGETDFDIYGSGPVNTTLSSTNFSVASSGRGTASITFTNQATLNFVFYVVSPSELLMMEDDAIGNPLLTGQVLQQTGTFTDAALNGVSVMELESLSVGTASQATAGLFTTNGGGTFNLSADQNLGGTTTTLSYSGTYSTSSNGRVTLSAAGVSTSPVFYLVGSNQAFVVGTSSLAVDSGLLQAQSGSSFTNSSLSGAYLGGSYQPVDPSVNDEVGAIQADANGNFSGTTETNGSGGPASASLTATYAVSSDGRVVMSQSGTQVGIIYLISTSQFVLLPSSDTNPKLSQFQH